MSVLFTTIYPGVTNTTNSNGIVTSDWTLYGTSIVGSGAGAPGTTQTPDNGEVGGFLTPSGNPYLMMGSYDSPRIGSRSAYLTLNLQYVDYLILTIRAGNDSNGGERPNNTPETFYATISGQPTIAIARVGSNAAAADYPTALPPAGTNGGAWDSYWNSWHTYQLNVDSIAKQSGINLTFTSLSSGNPEFSSTGGVGASNLQNAGDIYGLASIEVWGTYPPPSIDSFTATTQTSGSSGIPSSDITFSWSTTNTVSASIDQGVGAVPTSSQITVTTGLQSVAGSSSPATRLYTLTVVGIDGSTISKSVTVSVYNDNTPNDFNLPATTTLSTSLSSLDPNKEYKIASPQITGIDMITAVSSLSAGLDLSLDGVSWSSTIYITNNQAFYLRFTSQPFNTDPSGLTNSRTYNYKVGTLLKSFTATTRSPDVGEFFDFGDASVSYPYPDIDQVANTPTQYITSPTKYLMGDSGKPPDAEIPVEIKVNDPNVQVRITPIGVSVPGDWINVRQI
jgi:hypothetical protein